MTVEISADSFFVITALRCGFKASFSQRQQTRAEPADRDSKEIGGCD
jgi:hypothetical protein